jgi:hypothetical protein
MKPTGDWWWRHFGEAFVNGIPSKLVETARANSCDAVSTDCDSQRRFVELSGTEFRPSLLNRRWNERRRGTFPERLELAVSNLHSVTGKLQVPASVV